MKNRKFIHELTDQERIFLSIIHPVRIYAPCWFNEYNNKVLCSQIRYLLAVDNLPSFTAINGVLKKEYQESVSLIELGFENKSWDEIKKAWEKSHEQHNG